MSCAHFYHTDDLMPRDASGVVRWPCCRCGAVAAVPYGLAVNGTIIGPGEEPPPPALWERLARALRK